MHSTASNWLLLRHSVLREHWEEVIINITSSSQHSSILPPATEYERACCCWLPAGQKERALVLEPRILVMSHNIPNRLFSQFSYKVLDVPTRHLEEKYSDEATDGIITECLTKILNIGMHLAKYPKGSKNIPDAVFEKISELTIPQGFISHLLQCKEFLTPEQFLEIYDGPMNILLDSDRVWPTAVHLAPVQTRS